MQKYFRQLVALISVLVLSLSFSVCVFAQQEISDGTYKVSVCLWHSEDDKESMAAGALEETAYIVAENGTYTMHIRTGEMTMMFITASLQELCIADVDGNYTDAVIETKDANGNPTGFYFEMPHTEEYIAVKVNPHVALMGNRDIGARIKVDYSTLEKTADYVVPEPETTTIPVTVSATASTTASVVTTTSALVTTTQPETTTVPETTTAEPIFESEPVTEVFAETENTTEAPEDDDNGISCRGIAGIIAAVVLVVGVVVVIIIKKRA